MATDREKPYRAKPCDNCRGKFATVFLAIQTPKGAYLCPDCADKVRGLSGKEAAEIEIRNMLLNGSMRLREYQATLARDIVGSTDPDYALRNLPRGAGRTIIKIAAGLLRQGYMITVDGKIAEVAR